MKRIILVCLALLLAVSFVATSFAEEIESEEGTRFEKVLLTKGTLIKKEFIKIATFETDPASSYNNEKNRVSGGYSYGHDAGR